MDGAAGTAADGGADEAAAGGGAEEPAPGDGAGAGLAAAGGGGAGRFAPGGGGDSGLVFIMAELCPLIWKDATTSWNSLGDTALR